MRAERAGGRRYLVVGSGAIAARHLRNIRDLDGRGEIAVLHRGTSRGLASDAVRCADRVFVGIEEALRWSPHAAIVANAAPAHAPVGIRFGSQGTHLFVEKPIATELADADALIAACREAGATLAVGYNLRFHPPLEALRAAVLTGRLGRPLILRAEVGQHISGWRSVDYRESVSARRALGGGAVLELSHEVDYARWVLGEVRASSARVATVSDLDIDVEDTAELWLDFASGAVGAIHLDLLDRATHRRCRVVGSEGTIEWNGDTDSVRLLDVASGTWETLAAAAPHDGDMYLSEMRQFMACVEGVEPPRVTGESARATLAVCLAALRSASDARPVLP